MKQIFMILTAFVAFSTAKKNATFYEVEEPIQDRYIVVMQPGYDMSPIKKLILGDRSGIFTDAAIKHTYFKTIRGFSVKLPKRGLEKLLAREEIKYIVQDSVVRMSSVSSWGLDRVDQKELPLDGKADYTGDGTGVNVYIVDTGIYPGSLYFNGRAEVAFDSIEEHQGPAYGIDCNGHGTHCAGTIGGDLFGVAPGVKLYGVRVLDCEGNGNTANVLAGLEYVANSAKSPAVASMSLGGKSNPAIDEAVEGIIKAGVTVVAAAGNSNKDACSYSPARVKEAITVGATGSNDKKAHFSNSGECIDIFAPGVAIPSVGIGGVEDSIILDGTSMACPHVAGAAAISIGNANGMAPSDVKTKIENEATEGKITGISPDTPNRLLFIP
nr:aqualysin-1-like [Lytechinus pictus]